MYVQSVRTYVRSRLCESRVTHHQNEMLTGFAKLNMQQWRCIVAPTTLDNRSKQNEYREKIYNKEYDATHIQVGSAAHHHSISICYFGLVSSTFLYEESLSSKNQCSVQWCSFFG